MTSSPRGVARQRGDRVVLRRARVDHERLAHLAGQRDLVRERALLIGPRRVVAEVVEAGLADRAHVRVPRVLAQPLDPRRSRSCSSGAARPRRRRPRAPRTRRSAAAHDSSSVPIVRMRVTPTSRAACDPLGRDRRVRSAGGCGCRSFRLREQRGDLARPAAHPGARRSGAVRAPCPGAPSAASSFSVDSGMYGVSSTVTTRRPSAERAQRLVAARRRFVSSLASFHGAVSST